MTLTDLISYDPKLTLGDLLGGIIGAFGAAVLATWLAIGIGERIRKKNEKERREDKVLEDLIAYRNDLSSDRFLSALNRIPFVFHKNIKIRESTEDLHRAYTNEEKPGAIKDRIIKLISNISKTRKYHLSDSEIRNVFTKKVYVPKSSSIQPTSSLEIPTDPSSTVNADNNLTTIKTESVSVDSITSSEIGN